MTDSDVLTLYYVGAAWLASTAGADNMNMFIIFLITSAACVAWADLRGSLGVAYCYC